MHRYMIELLREMETKVREYLPQSHLRDYKSSALDENALPWAVGPVSPDKPTD
jgi:hypothetical protein